MTDTKSDSPLSKADEPNNSEIRKVALSGYLGNAIEYYDFALYTSASALIFAPLFFSDMSAAAGTFAAFATLAAGYVSRPLGGLVFGYIGDRYGRKRALLLTIWVMGVASGLIGMLPTFGQVGAAAPVLLLILRIVQGIAVGGEWGGAALLAAEHAPREKRGWYTAMGQAGTPTGGLLSTLAMAAVVMMPHEHLYSWGWRIPFLASFILLGIAIYVRMRVSESPLFLELDRSESRKRMALSEVLRARPMAFVRGVALSVPPVMTSSLFGAFGVTYAVKLGHNGSTVLAAVGCAFGFSILTTPLYGRLSDRIGRRKTYIGAAVAFALFIFPLFWAINTGSTPLLFGAFAFAFSLLACGMSAGLAAFLSELFPTDIRYMGVSISYQGGGLIAGFTPMIATALWSASGGGSNFVLIAVFAQAIAVFAIIAASLTADMRKASLRSV